MHHGARGSQCLRSLTAFLPLTAFLLLSLVALPAGRAGEWESMVESYDKKLKAQAKQIAEIEAREPRAPGDQLKRAEKITGDRITGIRSSLKGGGKAKSLADTPEKASGGASALIDLSKEPAESLDIVMREWGPEGPERRRLRDAPTTFQKNTESANAKLARATAVAETMPARVHGGVVEKVARIEAEASGAADRLRARWQREQAARDREREQREREAAERSRTIR